MPGGKFLFFRFDDPDETLHNGRVELGSGEPFQLVYGIIYREGGPVGPGMDHGVKGVGDGEDPRFEGYFVGLEPEGIAGPVAPLVVGLDADLDGL